MKSENKGQTATHVVARPMGGKDQAVICTERRSWIILVLTGFGTQLLRYFKTVRERGRG